MSERLVEAGKRFARLTTRAVVANPRLWRLLRRPMRAYFDWLARAWEERRTPASMAALEAALDRLDAEPRRALDVGTGTGLGARLLGLRYPNAEVVGLDLSPKMVKEAGRLLADDMRERVRFQVADASALPFADRTFDLVVLLNMIPFFDELARVTAPGGALIVSFSGGAATPIYVPAETLRERLAAAGFGSFEEVAAGVATALVARRAPA